MATNENVSLYLDTRVKIQAIVYGGMVILKLNYLRQTIDDKSVIPTDTPYLGCISLGRNPSGGLTQEDKPGLLNKH